MSRHTDAANAANHSKPAIDWFFVPERLHITTSEEFRREYMCEPLPLSFAG